MYDFDRFMNPQQAARSATRGRVVVYDYERGLHYRGGLFQRVLGPGRYRIWPFTDQRIVVLDIRRATQTVSNQKLLTSDQITVTLSLLVSYQIADPALAVHAVADCHGQLYADAQLALRSVVGAVTMDTLLTDRGELGKQALADVTPKAAAYGLEVLSLDIKDVILTPRVRDLLMREAEARREAQATLVAAREEVAAMRALANAARMAEEHPNLLRLRELDTVRRVAQAGGNTIVLGVGATPTVAPAAGTARRSVSGVRPDMDDAEE